MSETERCSGCGESASGRDHFGRAWCAPCWESVNARAHAWFHPAVLVEPTAAGDDHRTRSAMEKRGRRDRAVTVSQRGQRGRRGPRP